MCSINEFTTIVCANSSYILTVIVLCSLLTMILAQMVRFYFFKSKKKIVFFYKNSFSNKIIFYSFFVSIISWTTFTYLMLFSYEKNIADANSLLYGICTSIFTSFLISFMFHIIVTLRDATEKDEIALDAIGAIARAYLTIAELEIQPNERCPNKIEDKVYKLEDSIKNCTLKCSYNNSKCDYGNDIKTHIFGIKMNLETSYSLLSSVKPSFSGAIKQALIDVLLADRMTQRGIYVYNDFYSVKAVHMLLKVQGLPGFKKANKGKLITIADGKYFHKRYAEIVAQHKDYIERIKRDGVRGL